MRTIRFPRQCVPLFGVLAAIAPCARAQGGNLSLDADYSGYRDTQFQVRWEIVTYLAHGEALEAPSGLTTMDLATEGFWDIWTEQKRFHQSFPGRMTFATSRGDRLLTSFRGEGTVDDFGGAFTVTGGTGRYSNLTGGGTFRVQAAAPSGRSAMISIRGAASPAAIPEPSTLALLGLAGVTLLPAFRLPVRRRGG